MSTMLTENPVGVPPLIELCIFKPGQVGILQSSKIISQSILEAKHSTEIAKHVKYTSLLISPFLKILQIIKSIFDGAVLGW